MADEEIDYGEAEDSLMQMEAETSTAPAAATTGGRAPARDAAGRRLKGRGAASGNLTAMQEGGDYESIETKGGPARGPAKCARTPLSLAVADPAARPP